MLTPIRLFNTLSGTIEPLVPLAPPELGFYACGPTVYNRAHVGNFRTFVAIDVLRRTLTHFGYRVREVMNVTDVDDRIIQLAQEAGQDLASFTAQHIRGFEEDMATLRLQRPEVVPRATEHIQDMIALVERLTARGHTYTADGSVYFRIASFPEYGKLARLDAAGIQAGARVDSDKYDKENARDFVLWKFKSDEPAWAQWDAPFGHGRPGLAHRVLGDEHEVPGRDLRPARGRRRPDLPAPRERDRAERVRHRASRSRGTGCTPSTC